MKGLIQTIGDWLLPHICCLCQEVTDTHQDLCQVCKALMPWIEDCCYRCGLNRRMNHQHINLCDACIERPPVFDRLCALFSYDAPVSKLITGLKFGRQLAYGRVLGELLAEAVLKEWYQHAPLPDAIIPMPLHRKRLQKRGYNQALELLWPLLKQSKIPLLRQAVERARCTKPQAGLNAEQRKYNVRQAFSVQGVMDVEHVAIVDDVVTTGNTISSLCAVVKEAGVKQVDVWCICRA